MLATLLIWIYILIFSYIYGWTIVELIARFVRLNTEIETFSKPLIILVGLCGINTFAALLSLMINLSWFAQTIFLLLGIFLGWRLRKKNVRFPSIKLASIPWMFWILVFLVFYIMLENGTHAAVNPDTGIYHAQAIRWMETYPAVPGLGNLHSRLAYNSNWLVINAFFSFSFLGIRSFHVLPGVFLLVAITYLMGGTYKLLQREITITNVMKTLIIPLIFYTVGSQISSPGTDFPAIVWTWVTFSLWIEAFDTKIETLQNSIRLKEIIIFIFSIYLITIKLSTVPLLLLSVFLLIKYNRNSSRTFTVLSVLSMIILAPWFARNLILSGYWIYPMSILFIFSPNWDWKIPLENVVKEQGVIQAWARIPRADSGYVLAMPFIGWIKEWFYNLTLNQRFLVSGAVFSPIIFGITSFFVLRIQPYFKYYTFAYLVSYSGLAFWILSAPDIRFGYSYIIITVLLAGSPWMVWLFNITRLQKLMAFMIVSLITVYCASVLYHSLEIKTISARAILPIDYDHLPTEPCDLHGYTLLCAELYNACWYEPFPCIPPSNANPLVEMRGETIRSGFRFIKDP